jgi:hypothetical protein
LAEHVRRGIAYQIRTLRDQRGWNQGAFSKQLGKPQSVVSRLEDPSYGKFTIQTLLEISRVYDVALQVRFVPYSSFLQQTRDVSTDSMKVLSFDDDVGSKAGRAIQIKPLYEVFNTGITHIRVLDDDADTDEVIPPINGGASPSAVTLQ